jgi:hypothetical protein
MFDEDNFTLAIYTLLTDYSMSSKLEIVDIVGLPQTASSPNTPNASTGAITVAIGNAGTGEVYSSEAVLWNAPGIVSVPSTPNSATGNTDAAQGIALRMRDQDHILATRDLRTSLQAGFVNPGETCVYSPDGNCQTLYKIDGSITHQTTDSSGNNISTGVSATKVNIASAPFGQVWLDATGFHILTASGARFDLGGVNIPALSALGLTSYCTISAANFNANCTFIGLGSMPGILAPCVIPFNPAQQFGPPVPIFGSTVSSKVMISV